MGALCTVPITKQQRANKREGVLGGLGGTEGGGHAGAVGGGKSDLQANSLDLVLQEVEGSVHRTCPGGHAF